MSISRKDALEELARRKLKKQQHSATASGIRSELFDKQLAFIDDDSRNKSAICTRRAGKTSMWPRYATIVALEHPNCLIRIWGINRLRAKQLLWEEFRDVCARHCVGVKMHETELTIRFPNGSEIRLLGADKDKEVQKKRGDKTRLEIVLEAQLFGSYLRSLVEDVAEPCLFDQKGTMCLEGTPGVLPTGYWWCVTGGEDVEHRWTSKGSMVGGDLVGAGWSCHHWSLTDNPFVDQWKGRPNWRELAVLALAEVRKRRRWTEQHPTYVREYLGRWVRDDDVLLYKFDEKRNTFTIAEVQPWGPGWTHTLGWDLGSKDDMALVAWGWHPKHPDLYEAYSWKKPGALSDEVMEQIKALEARGFNFTKKVADTGGGGRMYVEDVMARFSQVFEAAKKSEKAEHIRLMNDEFLTARIKVQKGSPLALELAELPKDPDWDPLSGKAPLEDPRFPNHCADAGLYSWRAAWHFLFVPESDKPPVGSKAYAEQQEAAFVKKLEEQENGGGREWWEPTAEPADPW